MPNGPSVVAIHVPTLSAGVRPARVLDERQPLPITAGGAPRYRQAPIGEHRALLSTDLMLPSGLGTVTVKAMPVRFSTSRR